MNEYVRLFSGGTTAAMSIQNWNSVCETTKASQSPGEGWYQVEKVLPKPTPGPGQMLCWKYTVANGVARKEYFLAEAGSNVPERPVYSKLKILLAAREAGFLPALISMIEANPETKWIWDASNTIEDNELLAAYLPAVAEAIGKTPEEVRAFLDANCLAD